MSRIEFDFSEGLDALEEKLRVMAADCPKEIAAWKAFRGSLTPDQEADLFAVLRVMERREAAISARLLLIDLGKAGLLKVPHRRQFSIQQMQAALGEEKVRLARMERENEALKLRILELECGLTTPLRADWDYKPNEQRPLKRDEVVTDAPFGVEVVARQVEDFVRRHGKCSKTDVSAAFPQSRAFLAAAYRHLHASHRVHVNGWTLQLWPRN